MGMAVHTLLLNIVLEVLVSEMKQERGIKGIKTEKED